MNAIIEGEVVRFALAGKTVEFNVRVSKTLLKESEFTLGTVVSCKVHPAVDKDLVVVDYMIPVMEIEKESYKKAQALAIGDKVSVKLEKSVNGAWTVTGIKHNPVKGQDVGEFLDALEEVLDKREREKH